MRLSRGLNGYHICEIQLMASQKLNCIVFTFGSKSKRKVKVINFEVKKQRQNEWKIQKLK